MPGAKEGEEQKWAFSMYKGVKKLINYYEH
jgi:hypothetical protein